MGKTRLESLSDFAEAAHARIQKDYLHINPVVGLHQGMRDIGFPTDMMTIDCLKTQRRIIILLSDEQPDILSYQFAYRDKDPADSFEVMAFKELTEQILYDWIAKYFATEDN
ncbi:hypothetical protein FLL45_04670 [Aliikangiella marina]|uniref:Uncharacterized protein n=1 Tax=Aliikangiella marina TaxID=1712262 RepID=A0A545TJ27_9GAMM|nr:hypothetical protein [Aliikangiella marina]TQV77244.1 hypothetical protein FLL45_04670 [Aliikangiella marina]